MKIGIVTQALLANYGGILQNFALQQALQRLGHDPVTIDFQVPRYSKFRYLLSCCKTALLWFVPGRRRPFTAYPVQRRNADMEAFVRRSIATTRPVGRYTSDLVDEYGFEAVVTGSDQVWRPIYNAYLEDMYLRFVVRPGVRKIAYAASFGVDRWEYTPEQTAASRAAASRLDAISVRERSGVELCRNYLGVEAAAVLDPTMLLDRADYERLCTDIPRAETPFMAVYVLEMKPWKRRYIDRIASERHLPIRFFSADRRQTLSIEQWLAMFRDAAFVVTDSFHGSVFSIIFNKPFISIGHGYRGMARFEALLGMFGLKDRLCLLEEGRTPPSPGAIDWTAVNRARERMQAESFAFLRSSLQ